MLFKALSKLTPLTRGFQNRSVIFIAPTQKQARTIIWEALKTRLQGNGIANESRLEMRLPNEVGGHSTIFIGGWENRENYRGMSNVIHIEFDEVDTMKDFFIGWEEIFVPMLRETGGSAGFGGTPKKENPNLRRLEKQAEKNDDWECFHFTSYDNPHFSRLELAKSKDEMSSDTYRQEILAEYVENEGSLFKYAAIVDMFSNTIIKSKENYLIVDVADDGSDKTVFGFWDGLEMSRIEQYERLNTEGIITQIKEYAANDRIPYSRIAVDAIGVGAGVASSSLLDGIVGFKSSYQAMRSDESIVSLRGIHNKDILLTTEYKNLRSQCVFKLAELVNNHEIACRVSDVRIKEKIIEELALYQDISEGDGKKFATKKEDIVALLGRSPDLSDVLVMRMYFVLRDRLKPDQTEEMEKISLLLNEQFESGMYRQKNNSTK